MLVRGNKVKIAHLPELLYDQMSHFREGKRTFYSILRFIRMIGSAPKLGTRGFNRLDEFMNELLNNRNGCFLIIIAGTDLMSIVKLEPRSIINVIVRLVVDVVSGIRIHF